MQDNQFRDNLRVKDLGEQGLLQVVQEFCPSDMVGDDAALITVLPDRALVVTTDVLVDGIHFSLGLAAPGIETTSAADVGWRSAAANLSDLAAMGAAPLGITVGLSLPGDVPVSWVRDLYRGLTECLQSFNTAIVGGDLCRSSVVTVAIAAFGQTPPHQAIRRSLARTGDAILVTGPHGASRAGLELLLHPDQGRELTGGDRATLIQAHQRPFPRLDVIPVLHTSFEQPQSFRVAGMDSSDGLADALVQICRASGVGARVDRRQIPLPNSLQRWLSPEQAIDWALYGGEDFELVLCLAPEVAQRVKEQLGAGAAIVGEIVNTPEVVLWDSRGEYASDRLTLGQGFQHF